MAFIPPHSWTVDEVPAFLTAAKFNAYIRDALQALQDAAAVAGGDIQTFTASGTWTKPVGATWIKMLVIGGGSGGDAGNVAGAGVAANGGGGGAGGGMSWVEYPTAEVASPLTVTVAPGGAGGAGVTSGPGTPGTASGAATESRVQDGPVGSIYVRSGMSGAQPQGMLRGQFGQGSAVAPNAGTPTSGTLSNGGGGGGGVNTSNVAQNGAASAVSGPLGLSASGGAASGGAGTDGVGVGAGGTAIVSPVAASGGGGGAGNAAGTGGKGGNGGFPGGGGAGGGGVRTGSTSGAGGTGGAGIVVIITT